MQQYHTFEITQTLCNFIALFFKSFPSIFSFCKVDFKITLSLYKEKGKKGRKEKTKEGRKEERNKFCLGTKIYIPNNQDHLFIECWQCAKHAFPKPHNRMVKIRSCCC